MCKSLPDNHNTSTEENSVWLMLHLGRKEDDGVANYS